MQRVLVVDKNRKPLMPCLPARARELLKQGKAMILRRYPFTIILRERQGGDIQALQMKLDPGATNTGIALVGHFKRGLYCIWAAELRHRGQTVRANLLKRRLFRYNRRSRKTRYRAPRFLNRHKSSGWLAPSLLSRLNNIVTWFKRLSKFSPISHLSMELNRFDTQALQNPQINGVEYQQGELIGYEIREYLLEKWQRQCAYCGKRNIPFEVEHIIPKSRGGSNRISNLTLACRDCNQRKSNQTASEFGYPHIQAEAKCPLNFSAAISSVRWTLFELLQATGLPLELGTGGRTKFNRCQQAYPKTHWVDAVCVGKSGQAVIIHPKHQALLIIAKGRQCRRMVLIDKFGFPRSKAKSSSRVFGFTTGDLVRAIVPKGKKTGQYLGRLAVRSRGSFNISTSLETVQSISHHYCKIIHASDGYTYEKGEINSSLLFALE
jgi:5-methylcytosine-specific restriction endonuclease McrA